MKECLPTKPTGFLDCLLFSNAYRALKARQGKAPWRQGHYDEEQTVGGNCQSLVLVTFPGQRTARREHLLSGCFDQGHTLSL